MCFAEAHPGEDTSSGVLALKKEEMYYIGVDIGSTSAKTAVLDENKTILDLFVQPTGWSSVDTAEAIGKKLRDKGFPPEEGRTVSTGYGRVAVPFSNKTVTEITCHAKGASAIFGTDDLMIIDIGGQDTKVILIENGFVKDFVMNDKCSAGTGRFLEVMAGTLALRPDELCTLAASGGNTSISSLCTVFAESEVISLIGKGEKKENIAFGVVDSIVRKVAVQATRMLSPEKSVVLTGGLCECDYICDALGKELKTEVKTDPRARYAGAIGAALLAM